MSKTQSILLPLGVILLGAIVAVVLIKSRQEVQARKPEVLPPLVRAMSVHAQDHRFEVVTQGSVVPRTESALVSEVAGRVVRVSPGLADGGFFQKGEILAQVDPVDYEAAVTQAAATVAQAEVNLAREQEEARVAQEEWARLGQGEASPLTSRELHVAQAQASLESARAALRRAERDLDRTKIRAPYAGRVRQKQVDVGQFVNRGTPVALIFAVDTAEVRLPIPHGELGYLDLPLGYQGQLAQQRNPDSMPEVVLHTEFAGETVNWAGRVVRTEGQIDPVSRMVHVVAQVEDPYGLRDAKAVPLPVGLFVDASILGRRVTDVFLVPRSAIRKADEILVVDADSRLRFRTVEVLRLGRERAVIGEGLVDGDLICLSNLEAVTDGMSVRVIEEEGTLDPLGSAAEVVQ